MTLTKLYNNATRYKTTRLYIHGTTENHKNQTKQLQTQASNSQPQLGRLKHKTQNLHSNSAKTSVNQTTRKKKKTSVIDASYFDILLSNHKDSWTRYLELAGYELNTEPHGNVTQQLTK